jgi:hypothetical protein
MCIAARMPQKYLSYNPLSFFGLIMLHRNTASVSCPGSGILPSQSRHEIVAFLFVRFVATAATGNLEQQRLFNVKV